MDMDEKRILELACARLGVDVAEVLTYRVYEDHIAMVVNPGPKYKVPLSELHEPEPEIPDEAENVFDESEPVPPSEVDATDSARALAEEQGVDLDTIQGTGSGGRIIKRDVEAVL